MSQDDIVTSVRKLIDEFNDFKIVEDGRMCKNYPKDGITFVISSTRKVSKSAIHNYGTATMEVLKNVNIKLSGFLNDIKIILKSL